MLRVWVDNKPVGVLDRHDPRGSTFVYDRHVEAPTAVSLTMPVRTASWDTKFGLLPVFQMNLPEGELRARLKRMFAKATGTFDDFDLLTVLGRSQVGRIRYTAPEAELTEDVPFQSVDEILRARRGGDLYDFLLNKFASHSGLSGVQPKVMVRNEDGLSAEERKSTSVRGATHIVKFWDENEYPELAANEYFCLKAAAACGLEVPAFELSDDGRALVVERFDRLKDGGYLGFEDFCVLNGFGTEDKYKGSYESRLFKRVSEFLAPQSPEERSRALTALFKLFVLNCCILNCDAHLKNFGLTYEDAVGPVHLAPVYDLITTQAYLPKDAMALTLGGSTNWPDRKALVLLGQTRCDLGHQEVMRLIDEVTQRVAEMRTPLREYFVDRSKHPDVGDRMLGAWEAGLHRSAGKAAAPLPERKAVTP